MERVSYRWAIIFADGPTIEVDSTPEDLPDVVDFGRDIVCIVRTKVSS